MLAAVLFLALPLLAAPPAPAGHRCSGGEAAHWDYDAFRDAACRTEAQHVCRCRAAAGQSALYDAKRDLCLDGPEHKACLDKGGDYVCGPKNNCICDTKHRKCAEADLTAWKKYGCGEGRCAYGERLYGREPKRGVYCVGGPRWKCVEELGCPKKRAGCTDEDFTTWRAVGCAVRGCRPGEMAWARELKLHRGRKCPERMASRCTAESVCSDRTGARLNAKPGT